MATRLQSLPARTRVRKALGRMRRSPAVAKASESIALQLRRARQRFHGRFVRGVWLETAKYVASAPPGELGVFLPSDTPAGRIVVAAPTFVPFAAGRAKSSMPLHRITLRRFHAVAS